MNVNMINKYDAQIEVDSKTQELVYSKKNDNGYEMISSRPVDKLDMKIYEYEDKIIIELSDITKNGIDITDDIKTKRDKRIDDILNIQNYIEKNKHEIIKDEYIKELLKKEKYQCIYDNYWSTNKAIFTEESLLETKRINYSFRGDIYSI